MVEFECCIRARIEETFSSFLFIGGSADERDLTDN